MNGRGHQQGKKKWFAWTPTPINPKMENQPAEEANCKSKEGEEEDMREENSKNVG